MPETIDRHYVDHRKNFNSKFQKILKVHWSKNTLKKGYINNDFFDNKKNHQIWLAEIDKLDQLI